MWYICRHMWYEKLYLTFDCKVVKFHRWTPCKCIFCSHRAKTWPKSVIFVLNGILGNETSWPIGFLAITTFLIFWTPCISLLIFEKYHFRKIRAHIDNYILIKLTHIIFFINICTSFTQTLHNRKVSLRWSTYQRSITWK